MEKDDFILDQVLDSPQVLQGVLELDKGSSTLDPHLPVYIGIRRFLLRSELYDGSVADYLTAIFVKMLFSVDWMRSEMKSPYEYIYHIRRSIHDEEWNGEESAAMQLYAHLGNYCLFSATILPVILPEIEADAVYMEEGGQDFSELGRMSFLTAADSVGRKQGIYRTLSDKYEIILDALSKFSKSPFV